MKPRSVSAPGKAVLSGEYAVLGKAPALSVALDRRAVVRIAKSDDEFHHVATPGHADGRWRFTANDAGEIHWLDELPESGLRLIEEAWRVCMPRGDGHLSITIDTVDFFAPESGQKLGLGGSAAAMTALVGALAAPGTLPRDVGTLATRAHKALQNGLGSGVDIATSCLGGVIEFRRDARRAPQQRPWPHGLRFRFLWSGKAADTASRIRQLDSHSGKGWASLSAAAEAAATAWKRHNVAEVLEAFDRYTNTLQQFSIDHDLGIFDAGHDDVRNLATQFGVVYKPCGAGGGDIGIILAGDTEALDRICDGAEALGFSPLDVSPDARGVVAGGGEY